VQYLQKILNRLTFSGGLFLSAVAILPIIAGNVLDISLQFGGTSILIVVGGRTRNGQTVGTADDYEKL
jgi:preprotein translocase subunit SecY